MAQNQTNTVRPVPPQTPKVNGDATQIGTGKTPQRLALEAMAANNPVIAQMLVDMDKLEAQVKAQPADKELYLKVSAKGGISIYGFGQWPITLYVEQWGKLLKAADRIGRTIEWIKANYPNDVATKGQELAGGPVDAEGKAVARTAAIKLLP